MTFKTAVCSVCLRRRRCNEHHLWKRAVWGRGKENSETVFVCEDCHHIVDEIIKVKENKILKQYPEIYAGTLNEVLAIGAEDLKAVIKKYRVRPRRKKRRN